MTKRWWYGLDLRALALWRIALGLIALWDILLRARDLQTFYGDFGLLPRQAFVRQSWEWPGYHLFLATGSSAGLGFMFALWATAAMCLAAGYRHRLAGLLTWYLAASIQLRNPMVLDGGDDLLRVLLFWTPFLPLSARWSIDARRNPSWKALPNDYKGIATFGVLFQLFVLYLFAAILKNGDDWWKTGDALYYTVSIDQFATSFGIALQSYPDYLRPLTYAALAAEYALAALLLLRGRFAWAQNAFFLLAVSLHLGIASMLHFGVFMYVALAGLMVTFPTGWLDRLGSKVTEVAEGPASSDPPAYHLARPTRLFCGFMIGMIAVFNIYSVEHVQRIPRWSVPIAFATFEQQHWHFFAPNPPKGDGWYELEVTLADGSVTDGWNPGVSSGQKPPSVAWSFPNQRWRRWMQNLVDVDMPDAQGWRDSTLRLLARRWTENNPDKPARSFRLILWQQPNGPPGKPLPEAQRRVLSQIIGPAFRANTPSPGTAR